MVKVEQSGERRKDNQTRDDRLREIKREEGWVDVSDLLKKLNVSQAASA